MWITGASGGFGEALALRLAQDALLSLYAWLESAKPVDSPLWEKHIAKGDKSDEFG